jgi:hypothetical protein
VSANEKNRRARGDYGVLHRSLEAVESKKKGGHCSSTVDYCSKSLFTIAHCLLFTALFIIHYSLRCSLFPLISLSQSQWIRILLRQS